MQRRVSKSSAAIAFALALSLSTPVFAASRQDGGDPDFGTRIVRIVKTFLRHFVPGVNADYPGTPKP